MGVGIEVDAGIFGDFPKLPGWKKSGFKTRMDAIIAHEFEEYKGAEHGTAITRAPKTSLKISEAARKLLEELSEIFGGE